MEGTVAGQVKLSESARRWTSPALGIWAVFRPTRGLTRVSRRVAAEVRRASPYSKPIAIRAEPEVDCLRLMTCVEMRPIEGAII